MPINLKSIGSHLPKVNFTKYSYFLCMPFTYLLFYHLTFNLFENTWLNIVCTFIFVIPFCLLTFYYIANSKITKAIKKVSLLMMLVLCGFFFFYSGSTPKIIYSSDSETVLLSSQEYTIASPFADIEKIDSLQFAQIQIEQGILSATVIFDFDLPIKTKEELKNLIALKNSTPEKNSLSLLLTNIAQSSFDTQNIDLSRENPFTDKKGKDSMRTDFSDRVFNALNIRISNLKIRIQTSINHGPFYSFSF